MNEKKKGKIFRFNGDGTTAVNLEHVTNITIQEEKITFFFYTNQLSVKFDNAEAAKGAFEYIIGVWNNDDLVE